MIFNLFKSKPTLKDLIPKGFVDIHSHILPGIDDGAKNIKESKELVEKLINTFGLMGFNDDSFFSKKETEKNNTISKINNLVPILDEYYLPCKKRIYLRDIKTNKINFYYKKTISQALKKLA